MSTEFQIKRRLKLARGILEAPEKIADFDRDGLIDLPNGGWSHVRHDWESVCLYLLLTCFDLMGQSEEFVPFQDWLVSNREEHKQQRRDALEVCSHNDDAFKSAHQLYQFYNRIYGIRTAFNKGIDALEASDRRNLLDSIEVAFQRDYEPNVSKGADAVTWSLEDTDRKRREFIYFQRNRFTHRLENNMHISGPNPGEWNGQETGSYLAIIHDNQVLFGTLNQHSEFVNAGRDRCIYTTRGWPFIIMEILYRHIGVDFSRYELSLSLHVMVSGGEPTTEVLHLWNVPFSALAKPDDLRKLL